jgi:hypothetical protein
MARVDDYQQACDLARKDLASKKPDLLAGYAGASIQGDDEGTTFFILKFLDKDIKVRWPELSFTLGEPEKVLSIQEQVLLLHYLKGSWDTRGASPTGEWVAFQDIPDGRFYLDAFQKRAKLPLLKAFGEQPDRLHDLAEQAYGAAPIDFGDVAVRVDAFPLVPLVLTFWKGDDEFPPEGNLLFDQSISRILSAEDVAWLAGRVVYPLIGMAQE